MVSGHSRFLSLGFRAVLEYARQGIQGFRAYRAFVVLRLANGRGLGVGAVGLRFECGLL